VDDWRDVAIWRELGETPDPAGLLAAAAAADPRNPASVSRLRSLAGEGGRAAALAAAALELAEARRRAVRKFEGAADLWCDVAGVEQASGTLVARWKAERIRKILGAGAPILDLCCGIGGDAIGGAQRRVRDRGRRCRVVRDHRRRGPCGSRAARGEGWIAFMESR